MDWCWSTSCSKSGCHPWAISGRFYLLIRTETRGGMQKLTFGSKKCSKQFGNGVERDARRCGFVGREHGGGRQRAHAVLLVKRIHGGQQLRPALLALHGVEQAHSVQMIGHEPA